MKNVYLIDGVLTRKGTMYVNFKSLQIKNFCSYGNNLTEISFREGMHSIVGRNGAGKSSAFLDGIFFNLFGVPYRSIKIADLINKTNKKDLFTKSEFSIGSDDYSIERSLKPSEVLVYKNGQQLDVRSSKKLIQEDINTIIGTNEFIFRNIISLAVNNNKPFITLKADEKRVVIDNIFGIKIYTDMLKLAKKDISQKKLDYDIYSRSLRESKNSKAALQKSLEICLRNEETFEEERSKKIKSLEDKIQSISKEISSKDSSSIKSEVAQIDKDLSKKKSFEESVLKMKSTYETKDSEIKKLKKEIEFFKTTKKCSICKTDITEEHKKLHIDDLQSKIDECMVTIKSIKEKSPEVLKKKKYYEDLNTSKNSLMMKLSREEENLKNLNRNLTMYKNELSSERNRSIELSSESIKESLNDLEVTIKDHEEKFYSTDKEIKRLEVVSGILSDKGIKSYFMKNLLPILNEKMNYYLNMFDTGVHLEIDEFMKTNLSKSTNLESFDYFSFSEGEKKRIDLAILLSFIDTTKTISNWNCNVLFFDELLDNAIDGDGLDRILSSIKSMCLSEERLGVYIITHKIEDLDMFDTRIQITKENGFSEIQVS